MTTTRVEWLEVGGPAEPWERLGLIAVDGLIPLFGPGLRVTGKGDPGLRGWALSGEPDSSAEDPDGLATTWVAPTAPVLVDHPLGAISLDHVVVSTDSLDRTCAAITAATGAPLRRVRDLGAIRQGFHRLGGLVVEVVERAGQPAGPASFWGLVLNVEDLDAACVRLGPDLVSDPKDAVQPGRRIATIRDDPGRGGLGLPVALMTPDPRR